MDELHTVGTLSREVGISADTLRDYEKRGIVQPQRDASGRRLYTKEQAERVKQFRANRRSAHTGKKG